MKCPYCHHIDTQVIDTRVSEEGNVIRRRRRCADCDKRFTTYERVELVMPVIVKKNGSRTEYESNKLRASFMLALRKRPVSAEAIDSAIQRIEEKTLQRRTGNHVRPSGRTGHARIKTSRQNRLHPFCFCTKVLKTSLNSPRRYKK
jgi:transcriptional repressor NrdR